MTNTERRWTHTAHYRKDPIDGSIVALDGAGNLMARNIVKRFTVTRIKIGEIATINTRFT
jgi:hypothetical protein